MPDHPIAEVRWSHTTLVAGRDPGGPSARCRHRLRVLLGCALLAFVGLATVPPPAGAASAVGGSGTVLTQSASEFGVPSDPEWEVLSRDAEIRRDGFGVPHIRAETLRAAGFALGWVQLEDYGERVITGLIRARGEASMVLGAQEASVQGDVRARRDHRRALETFHRLAPEVRDVYQGFALAVNRYLELHPDEVPEAAGMRFTGHDLLARDVVSPSWGAASRFVSALEERSSPDEASATNDGSERASRSTDAPLLTGSTYAYRGPPEPAPRPAGWEEGSNTWALAPSRTASGNAVLMRNPHLSWTAGYYEAQIEVPGVLHFHGDFRIGGPFGIIGGFNRRLGWSTTNNGPDLNEIYALVPDPNREDHYLLDGASHPLELVVTPVTVRDNDDFSVEVSETWETSLGPVVHRTSERIYVLRSAGDGEFRLGEQFYRMMTAGDLDEWKDAMRMQARIQSNIIYADADGNIFYVWNARHPVRPHPPGGDTLAVEARSSDDVWTRIVPFDSLPQLLNPPGGYVRNENDPFHHTNLNAILPAEDFPDDFPEPRVRLRSQRSLELIHAAPGASPEPLSLEAIWELKHDARVTLADRVLDDLLAAVRLRVAAGERGLGEAGADLLELEAAADLLEAWDRTAAADQAGALLFAEWWDAYVDGAESASASPESAGFGATPESLFVEPWSPDRPMATPRGLAEPERGVDALEEAMRRTAERWGDWRLSWGEVHRARHGDLDLPVSGCDGILGCFRVLWFTDDDDGLRRIRGGDGWVFAVEFGDVPRAFTILAYGQSDREHSPHHIDQLSLFVEGGRKDVAFTPEAVEAVTRLRYRPGVP